MANDLRDLVYSAHSEDLKNILRHLDNMLRPVCGRVRTSGSKGQMAERILKLDASHSITVTNAVRWTLPMMFFRCAFPHTTTSKHERLLETLCAGHLNALGSVSKAWPPSVSVKVDVSGDVLKRVSDDPEVRVLATVFCHNQVLPPSHIMLCNGQECDGEDITACLSVGENTLEYVLPHDGATCVEFAPMILNVKAVGTLDVDEVLKSVKPAKGVFDPLSTSHDGNIVVNYPIKISLLCVYTKGILKHPGKGVACKHNSCFNLRIWISSPSTRCPICNAPLAIKDLRSDPGMERVLSERNTTSNQSVTAHLDAHGRLTLGTQQHAKVAGTKRKTRDAAS